MGASYVGRCSCDWWEAQWQLRCTITAISYGRQIDQIRRIEREYNIEWECQRGSSQMRRCR